MEIDTSANAASQPTYILDPLTHEVYEVPGGSLRHDAKNPVWMEYDAFEHMGATGQLSGERLLHHNHAVAAAFNASQVLNVQLKASGGGPKYAWASRMVTALPEDVFPNVDSPLVGHEFVWLWPPAKAFNAFLTRKDKLRLNPEQRASPIDEIEPSCRHTPAATGGMLGPGDVEGAVLVPYERLSPVQRFYIMCINSQRTLFPRRPTRDRWTERVTSIINRKQELARIGGKWNLHNSVQRMLKRANAEEEDATECERGLRKRAKLSAADASDTEETEGLEISDVDELLHDKERWQRRKRAEERGRRWAALPHELLVRILCTLVSNGITSPVLADARAAICTLRAVSKGARALTDSYVGIQLTNAVDATFDHLVPTNPLAEPPREPMTAVAARVRALGIGMSDVVRLVKEKVCLRVVEGWTLPSMTSVVPDWRWYLELRREALDRNDGGRMNVKRWTVAKAPDEACQELMDIHRAAEPLVWGARFPAAVVLEHDYEEIVAATGDCRIRDQMHSLAGVGG